MGESDTTPASAAVPSAVDPIARLAELGLERPAACTMRRFLMAAAVAGLLPEAAVVNYLDVYDQVVHGGGGDGDVAQARAPLAEALAEVAPSDPRLAAVREHLAPQVPESRWRRAAREVAINRLEPDEEIPGESAATVSTGARRPRAGRRNRARWLAALAGLWTVLVLAVGVFTGPALERGVRGLGERWLGWRVGDPARLARLQRYAGENPADDGIWARLVAEARRLERWEVVVLGMRHLVARSPADANLHNELAWLLLTGPEPWLRDPVQALALAERAYALDPSPNVIDTLAEAAYQTGDPLRAVSLEMIAISKVEGNSAFFERQLAKFRAAAEAARQQR